MTANELADKLEKPMIDNPDCPNFSRTREFMEQVVAMLRQQQAELTEAGGMIGVLREYISDLENGLDSSIKLNKAQAERNNKPVALVSNMCNDSIDWKVDPLKLDEGTPLYTHPASKAKDRFPNYESICLQCGATIYKPFKELTDEEIDELANKYLYVLNDVPYANDIKDFARAILRKAKEKC